MVAYPFIIDRAADAFLDALHASSPFASSRMEDVLDHMEDDPTHPKHRSHLLAPTGTTKSVWGIKVIAGSAEFMILWSSLPGEDGADAGIHILYVGPNSLL